MEVCDIVRYVMCRQVVKFSPTIHIMTLWCSYLNVDLANYVNYLLLKSRPTYLRDMRNCLLALINS